MFRVTAGLQRTPNPGLFLLYHAAVYIQHRHITLVCPHQLQGQEFPEFMASDVLDRNTEKLRVEVTRIVHEVFVGGKAKEKKEARSLRGPYMFSILR